MCCIRGAVADASWSVLHSPLAQTDTAATGKAPKDDAENMTAFALCSRHLVPPDAAFVDRSDG